MVHKQVCLQRNFIIV